MGDGVEVLPPLRLFGRNGLFIPSSRDVRSTVQRSSFPLGILEWISPREWHAHSRMCSGLRIRRRAFIEVLLICCTFEMPFCTRVTSEHHGADGNLGSFEAIRRLPVTCSTSIRRLCAPGRACRQSVRTVCRPLGLSIISTPGPGTTQNRFPLECASSLAPRLAEAAKKRKLGDAARRSAIPRCTAAFYCVDLVHTESRCDRSSFHRKHQTCPSAPISWSFFNLKRVVAATVRG